MANGNGEKDVNKMFTINQMRGDIPPIVVREGVALPWMVSERAVKEIKDYEIRDDDVWVITYPKSGTHWAAEIVNLIMQNGEEDKIDRKKRLSPLEFDPTQPGSVIPPNFLPEETVPLYERCKGWPSPRIFMTHLPEHMIPRQLLQGIGKVIFLIRNPKDRAVSEWHFLRPVKINPAFEQWDTFLEISLKEGFPFGTWFTHNLPYWRKHRHDENFLFLKYEDMKRDLRKAVNQIADFLGRPPLSDEVTDRIVKFSTLESMRQRFHTTDETSGKQKKIGQPGVIRKGMVGDWKTQFTVAQNEAFDKLFSEKVEGSDLHIDFEIS